jgi:hypothetical protein
VDAAQFFAEYDRDEATADQQYKGRTVRVRGIIRRAGTEPSGTPSVYFGGQKVFAVRCLFPRSAEHDVLQLAPRMIVIIEGQCVGRTEDVTLEDCRLVQVENCSTRR